MILADPQKATPYELFELFELFEAGVIRTTLFHTILRVGEFI